MERLLVFFLSTVFCCNLSAQLPVLHADSLQRYFTEKVKLLDRDNALRNQYRIDLYGVTVYASAAANAAHNPEYFVSWSDLDLFRNIVQRAERSEAIGILQQKKSNPFPPEVVREYEKSDVRRTNEHAALNKTQPLAGYRIALDPGHVADDLDMGKVEQKYLDFKLPGKNSDSVPVQLVEGQLTWATALLLKTRLEKAGATVLLTREGPGMTAFGKTYRQWMQDDYQRTLDSLVKVKGANDPGLRHVLHESHPDPYARFRYVFRDAELRKRAERINAFHPDYTLIIHYNVDETNTDWKKTSDRDFCMAFVGGAFQAGELDDAEKRYDFLRLLLTEELEKSTRFSSACISSCSDALGVPLAKQNDATYLVSSCKKTSAAGVFARNLANTRLVQGTLEYGETLYQDNVSESLFLMQNDVLIPGTETMTSKRVATVANAYYDAVIKAVSGR